MINLKTSFALLLLVTISVTACTSSRYTATPVEIEGMNNSARVGDLLIGGQPLTEALAGLKDDGYRTIVTLRAEGELDWDEQRVVDSLGMRFVSIPMPGPVDLITNDQVEQFDAVMQLGNGPVVLHCGSGNRAAALWAIWLVEKKGVKPTEAVELAEKAGLTRMLPLVEKQLGLTSRE